MNLPPLRFSTLAMSAAALFFLSAPTLSILNALPAWEGEQRPDNWSEEEMRVLASLQLSRLPPIPSDPSNRIENLPQAVTFGKQLFFDTRLARNEKIACASCHDPKQQFQDGRPLSIGLALGTRRTMPLGGVAYTPFLFWDGRKDSLWSQALAPLENKAEMGNTRLGLAHLVQIHYQKEYESLFGRLPDLSKLPQQASPLGTPEQQDAWQVLPKQTRHDISIVFANLGKALAAYQKTLHYTPGRLDQYVAGVLNNDIQALKQLSTSEKNGLRLFIGKAQCITCHNGPLLTDHSFHNTGVAPGPGQPLERGRMAAVEVLMQDPFNCLGPYSDARPGQCAEMRFLATDNPAWLGSFKTPTLRGVVSRAPYMHNGQLTNMEMVAQHYQKALPAKLGHNERDPMQLGPAEITDLVAFLHTLNGSVIEAPAKQP